jgi:hypothetical protein
MAAEGTAGEEGDDRLGVECQRFVVVIVLSSISACDIRYYIDEDSVS